MGNGAVKKHRPWLAAILISVFLIMLVLNFLTPLTADDFFFCFSCDEREPIESFGELISSLSYMRENINGRVFPHFLSHVFLMLPKGIFNVINSVNAAVLIYLLYRFIKSEDSRKDMLIMLGLVFMIWILLPAFGQILLWLTGSFNYSWTISFSLIFIYPFFREYMKRTDEKAAAVKTPRHKAEAVLMCGEAFVAGAYSESGAFSMLAAAFCFLLLIYVRDKKLPGYLLLRFIIACGGFLFLMLTPSELGGKSGDPTDNTFTENIQSIAAKLSTLPGSILTVLIAVAVIGLLIIIWAFIHKKKLACILCIAADAACAGLLTLMLLPEGVGAGAGFMYSVRAILSETKLSLIFMFAVYFALLMLAILKNGDIKKIMASAVFGVAAIASIAVFVFAVYFPARSACPATFYTGIGSAILLSSICSGKSRGLRACTGIIAAVFILCFALGVSDIKYTYDQNQQRQEYFAEARRRGEEHLILEQIYAPSKYSAVWPREYANFNMDMAEINGFEEIWINGIDYA